MFINVIIGFVAVLVVSIVILMILMSTKPEIFMKNKKNGEVISSEDRVSSSSMVAGDVVGDTKDFIPVHSFEDNAMDLGNHNYRAIIEVSSVNYGLMNEMEQQMVESVYHTFLNSLNFPIEIYIQTREFDRDLMMDNLKTDISKSSKRFKNISGYAKEYLKQMENVTQYIGNSKIKKKYIIVPYNNTDLSDVSELTHYEIKQFALDELYNRCLIIMSGIGAVGLTTNLLNKPQIAECLYAYYHRNSYRIASDIMLGSFDSLVVDKKNAKKKDARETLDNILLASQNRIKNELISSDTSQEELAFYNYVYSMLEYFKQNDRSGFIGDVMTEKNAVESGYAKEYYSYQQENPGILNYTNYDIKEGDVTPHYYNEGGE